MDVTGGVELVVSYPRLFGHLLGERGGRMC